MKLVLEYPYEVSPHMVLDRSSQQFKILIKIPFMKQPSETTLKRVHAMVFAKVYPMYVAKAERKGRTKDEVNKVIHWLTGYTTSKLESEIEKETSFENFFKNAPKLNPSRKFITGVVCGVRVEDIEDSILREVRYLDKLVDELAKGKTMDKILRKSE